jgi:hypothetical protein
VSFHIPNVFNRSMPIQSAILNNVHTLRNISEDMFKKASTWLQINKEIGVGKIRFCALDLENALLARRLVQDNALTRNIYPILLVFHVLFRVILTKHLFLMKINLFGNYLNI